MDQDRDIVFALPLELYYDIFTLLDIQDILALRKTCKRFNTLTRDRDVWSTIFTRLRATQALPYSRAEFMAMSTAQAERALLTATQLEASFLTPKAHLTQHIPRASTSTSTWHILSFISDRFLLSADNATVAIWDTAVQTYPATSQAVVFCPWAQFPLTNILGYADWNSRLYMAVSHIHANEQRAVIYSVYLPPPSMSGGDHDHIPVCLHQEASFVMHEGELLKHLDPSSRRALLYCSENNFQVVHWHDNERKSGVPLLVHLTDGHDLWDGITSLRFCGPYILCFRLRSLEAYPISMDAPTGNALPVLRYKFGSTCFRAVSLSHVRVSYHESGDIYTVYMLTNDIHKGMFHYRIRVTTKPVPSLLVHILAQGGIRVPDSPSMIPGTDERYTLGDLFARMYVSTWSLGSVGLRGVWVDRQRGSIDRRVVAFTTNPARLRIKQGVSSECDSEKDEGLTMEGNVVHVISSYDLRDDVTICAVSEWTGRIAMVSRAGAILLL